MSLRKSPRQHLANVPLFSSCNSRDLDKIAKASERLTLKAGTTMITQGTAGKQAYVILAGTATLKRNGKKIASAEAGAMVGELSLLDQGSRTATVVCDSDCDVLVLEQRKLLAVIDEVPAVGHKLLAALATRIRDLDRAHYG
ncbi:MAG: cyclic nucleotide-binding domain-containing protein [Actinobacteria bacterium]|nr:cyclic nucleotide-binding domain-containing protein [Actinomycetota bacterium]